MDIQERENLRNHALDNIKEFENVLNEIISSNNPEEKKVIISNSKETVIDESANIEDDLNPDKSASNSSDFIKVDAYLERFPLVFVTDNSQKAVTFSNIYVSNVHTDEYTYISVYFECLFAGSHKVTNKKYKKVIRVATIKSFANQDKTITKIVNIKFSTSSELSKIKKESIAFDKEYKDFQESASYKQKLAEQEYNFYIEAADKDFANKDYETAETKYKAALKAKPNDRYASDKISECERQIELLEKNKLFIQLVDEADKDFAHKKFNVARNEYLSAQKIKPGDSHVNFMLGRIERKINPLYPNKTTAYLGINYAFNETVIKSSTNSNTFKNGFDKDFQLDRLEISFYYPIGLYVSGIKQFSEPEPQFHYTMETVNQAKQELLNSQTPFTDLTYSRKGEHTGAFNAGIYLSFFRPIYFKLGMSQHFGSQWDLYSGDLKGKINYSSNNSGLYAVNYESTNHTDFQAGFAIVIPYVQLESTYDNFSQSLHFSAGLNYPFKNVYFLKRNPNKSHTTTYRYKKDDSERKYPYQKTKYIAVSYDFFNFYPDEVSDFKFNYLTDKSFSSPILEKFSISYYYKFGGFISGYNKTKDQVPNIHYATSEVNQARNNLINSQIPFTELSYLKSESNYTKFNLGITGSFFRPLQFKAGLAFVNGSMWDVYSGDYKNYLSKYNGTNYYALNYIETIDKKFVGGVALVFPYCQIEFMYDGFYNKYSASIGLNLPIVK